MLAARKIGELPLKNRYAHSGSVLTCISDKENPRGTGNTSRVDCPINGSEQAPVCTATAPSILAGAVLFEGPSV